LYVTDSKNSTVTQIHIAKIFDIPVGDSPVLGNKGAPVSLVAFLDIQCPYCARVFPTLEKVLEAHPEKVKVVIKHFPLRMHRFARQAARASLAAAQQEAYLPMLKKLFADARHLNESKISSFVEQLGLDKDRFEKAYKGSSAAQQVARDMQLGRSVGVRGVPALFINGRAAKRRSFQALSAMIQQEIKQE
jgi:protein-disulfide isomerase